MELHTVIPIYDKPLDAPMERIITGNVYTSEKKNIIKVPYIVDMHGAQLKSILHTQSGTHNGINDKMFPSLAA